MKLKNITEVMIFLGVAVLSLGCAPTTEISNEGGCYWEGRHGYHYEISYIRDALAEVYWLEREEVEGDEFEDICVFTNRSTLIDQSDEEWGFLEGWATTDGGHIVSVESHSDLLYSVVNAYWYSTPPEKTVPAPSREQ